MLFRPRMERPEPEDLRCEYQTSEIHIAALTSGVWQSAAIVVGGSIAAFAFLIDVTFTCSVAAAVTALGAGAVVVICMWQYNWRRHKRSIDNRWVRMRQIERARGMRVNTYMYLLTLGKKERECNPEWEGLSKDEQERFRKGYKEFPQPRCIRGQFVLHATACLVRLGWLLVIAFAWYQAVSN